MENNFTDSVRNAPQENSYQLDAGLPSPFGISVYAAVSEDNIYYLLNEVWFWYCC